MVQNLTMKMLTNMIMCGPFQCHSPFSQSNFRPILSLGGPCFMHPCPPPLSWGEPQSLIICPISNVSLCSRFLMVLLFLSVYLISWFDLKIMLYRGAWRPAIRFWYHTYWNFGISFGIWSPTPHIPQNPHFLNIVSLILLELMTWLKAYIEEDLKLPKIVLGVKVASDCTENPPNAEEK